MPNLSNSLSHFTSKIKIGLFDSGIGGFSVLVELFKQFPEAEYFYVADRAYAPYGPKSDEEILERANRVVGILLNENVDLVVVACNTATAVAIENLRANYPEIPFVGVEPYLNSFHRLKDVEVKKMVVLTTISTGKSERFKRLKSKLDPEGKISHFSLPELASLVEKGDVHGFNESLKLEISEELKGVREKGCNFSILGCTHYPLIAKWIEEVTGTETLSPCPYVAKRVVDLLTNKMSDQEKIKNGNESFYYLETTKNIAEQKFIVRSRKELLDKYFLIKNYKTP